MIHILKKVIKEISEHITAMVKQVESTQRSITDLQPVDSLDPII